jgi:hypothetical protein
MSYDNLPPPPPPPRPPAPPERQPDWGPEAGAETIRLDQEALEGTRWQVDEPPASPRRRSLWPWVALGLGVGTLTVALVCGALLLLLPPLREELLLLVAPPAPAAAVPPESPARPAPAAASGLARIDENFDAPSAMWETAASRMVDGQYELRVDTPNFDSYGLFLAGTQIGDLDLALDVTQVEGPLEAEYGLRFRQPGPENYLMLSISSGGYYRLLRVAEGEFRSLTPWTFEPRIKTGLGATNRLRVAAEGAQVRAWINDHQVLTFEDTNPQPGQLGLGVTTFGQGGVAVRFDTLEGQVQGVEVAERFENPAAAPWSVGGSQITGGAYEMFASAGIQLLQQPQPPGSSRAREFRLEVEGQLAEVGGEGAGYGVLFGYTENFQYYGLLILADGRVALTTPEGGAQISPEPLPMVNAGPGASNRIRVEARERRLLIAINDETVFEAENVELAEGEVGMLLSSGSAGQTSARFDSFRFEVLGTRT